MTIGTLELPGEIEERFEGLAQLTGMTKNSLILGALREWLENQPASRGIKEINSGGTAETTENSMPEKLCKDSVSGAATGMPDKGVFYLSQEKWEAFTKALDATVEPDKALAELFSEDAPW